MTVLAMPAPPAAGTDLAFRVSLDRVERLVLAGLMQQLVNPPSARVDDPAWLERARTLGCHLPVRLREAIRRYRHDPGTDGILVLSGLPIDPARLPDTPTAPESVQRIATVPAALAVAIGTQLGEIVAYRDEKGGALVQDVVPVPGFELSQSNAGSVPLQLHVENAFHDAAPDYVGLICLRNDDANAAGTMVVSIRRVVDLLAEEDRTVLRQSRFLTAPPPSFHRGTATAPHPVLGGCPDDPDVRLDVHATRPQDVEAGRALERLCLAMEQATTCLTLRPGDMALLDNRVVLHGRTRFTPRYDGQDRWLHRVYIQLDNRRSRSFRSGNGAVLS
jgi:L-asparagine oxygenase